MIKDILKSVVTICLVGLIASWYLGPSSMPGIDKVKDLPRFGTNPKNPQIPPIVKISRDDEPFCTAFVIDANYALTAAHCLVNAKGYLNKAKVQVLLEDGTDIGVTADPVAVNNRMDVGLIKGDFNNFKVLKVDFYEFSAGERPPLYAACGYPYGQKRLLCTPFLLQTNSGFTYAGQGFMIPGMSGGPLISVKDSVVIGINVAAGEGMVMASSVLGALAAFDIE